MPKGCANFFDVKFQKISFKETVAFGVKNDSVKEYPSPYYKIEGGKAIPLYGIYVEDLLKIIKEQSPYMLNFFGE